MSNNLQSYLTEDEKTVIQWNDKLKRSSFIVDMIALFLFFLFAAIFVVILVVFRTFSRDSRVENNNNICILFSVLNFLYFYVFMYLISKVFKCSSIISNKLFCIVW